MKYKHEMEMKGMNQQIDRLENLQYQRYFSKISGGITQLTGIESIDKKNMKNYQRDPDN